MHTIVNNTRIWFDVDGAGLVADGPVMRHRPTLVLLHGGPGFDHSWFKPDHGQLTDVAQILYVDHRGNGRSGPRINWQPVRTNTMAQAATAPRRPTAILSDMADSPRLADSHPPSLVSTACLVE